MKKISSLPLSLVIIGALLLLGVGVFSLRFLLGGSEDSWICQDGQWIKHGNPSAPAPSGGCGEEKAGQEGVVVLYFDNEGRKTVGEETDCGVVYGVERTIPYGDGSLPRLALEQLFGGPSEAEKAQGYSSFFSEKTKEILLDFKVENETAYVNFKDIRSLLPNITTSCGSAEFLAQAGETLKHYRTIKKVIYAIEGDPETFYEWMQFGCSAENNFCDKKPFLN
jgi:hypothetical protein